MQRFYRHVTTAATEGGFAILLDGKPMRTPLGRPLAVPTEPLAQALAQEWDAQTETVDPNGMALTRLANTAVDRTADNRDAVVAEVSGFGASDLVCYRADRPQSLARRQTEAWDPFVEWLRRRFDIALRLAVGVMPIAQDAAALERLRRAAAAHSNPELTALHELVGLTGSLAIGLALSARHVDADAAWAAAHVDERFQAEQWGIDDEARQRSQRRRSEFDAADRFLSLLR